MCLTRIYTRRRRDGRLLRFNSVKAMRDYNKAERESRRSLPQITRTEFIGYKRSYENPTWVRSKVHDGMAMLVEGSA
jgi:hypothetical protein